MTKNVGLNSDETMQDINHVATQFVYQLVAEHTDKDVAIDTLKSIIENYLAQEQAQMRDKIQGLKEESDNKKLFDDYHQIRREAYNQAITDVLAIIEEQK